MAIKNIFHAFSCGSTGVVSVLSAQASLYIDVGLSRVPGAVLLNVSGKARIISFMGVRTKQKTILKNERISAVQCADRNNSDSLLPVNGKSSSRHSDVLVEEGNQEARGEKGVQGGEEADPTSDIPANVPKKSEESNDNNESSLNKRKQQKDRINPGMEIMLFKCIQLFFWCILGRVAV